MGQPRLLLICPCHYTFLFSLGVFVFVVALRLFGIVVREALAIANDIALAFLAAAEFIPK